MIDERWWLNCKANGKGVFLRNRSTRLGENIAEANPEVVRSLFRAGVVEAGGRFPDYVMKLAKSEKDAPGCCALAARDWTEG